MAESEEHGSILEDSDMILERREEQEHLEDLGDVSSSCSFLSCAMFSRAVACVLNSLYPF